MGAGRVTYFPAYPYEVIAMQIGFMLNTSPELEEAIQKALVLYHRQPKSTAPTCRWEQIPISPTWLAGWLRWQNLPVLVRRRCGRRIHRRRW
jgi:hypothetical protein